MPDEEPSSGGVATRGVGTSKLGNAGDGAVLVLLGGPAANAAAAFRDTVPDDRHRALARDHVPTLGRHDALDDRTRGALHELAARPGEGHRRNGLALGTVDARPDRAVHTA